MRSVFVTHPKGGEGKQTCTVTCMDREWFPEKPELGAENQKSNYLLWHSWTFLRKKSNTELLYFIKTLLPSDLDTFNFANQCLFAKANQDKKSSVGTSVPGCKWQMFCLDGKRKIWLFFFFCLLFSNNKSKFHYGFGQKLSVKGFHLKTMQTSISAFQNEDVLQPSLQKLCGCWAWSLTNSFCWDLSLKKLSLNPLWFHCTICGMYQN